MLPLDWCSALATSPTRFGSSHYASTVADCDYTSCGPSYPEGTVDIEAARITSPATLSLNNTVRSDRDGDGMEDTVQINYGVLSNAFFEDLDVEVNVRDSSGQLVDTITDRVAAGGGVPIDNQVYFTAPLGDQYSFEMVMMDMLGDVVDTLQTSPQMLSNMKPVANGSVSLTDVQTWENINSKAQALTHGGFPLPTTTCLTLTPHRLRLDVWR